MADKYGLAVDISMLIISSLLVFSAASNEKIYDAGATFKTDSPCRSRSDMAPRVASTMRAQISRGNAPSTITVSKSITEQTEVMAIAKLHAV